MELEQQVTSLKLSKKLKRLGVKQESLFAWGKSVVDMKTPKVFYIDSCGLCGMKYSGQMICSAFTPVELGEMLPEQIEDHNELICNLEMGRFYCNYIYEEDGSLFKRMEDKTEAEARGLMLEYLLKNNLIKKGGKK